MHMKRKGFTLTELLITITIITILMTMFMLSSVNASRSADYNKVITNLRNLSMAAMSFYSANIGRDFTKADIKIDIKDACNLTPAVKNFLSNITGMQDADRYYVYVNKNDNPPSWWAGYDVNMSGESTWSTEETALSQKLAARAQSLNLRASDNTTTLPKVSDSARYTQGKKYVWMLIRKGR